MMCIITAVHYSMVEAHRARCQSSMLRSTAGMLLPLLHTAHMSISLLPATSAAALR